MNKVRKKKKEISSDTISSYDLSLPHEYYLSTFGIADRVVRSLSINTNVGNLLQDFNVFEDLNNVQSWPISTLIQRELDHERAKNIAKDYLLNQGDATYFPPLIAVLIPVDDAYKPLESFPDVRDGETEFVIQKYIAGVKKYSDYEDAKPICGGIHQIELDYSTGDVVWDKNIVSAVIIDGQHRYKALQNARREDRAFDSCMVNITLVDLIDICKRTNTTPTDVARDLFVTINNTPIEVDETRLVLMDDKDVLSTFTQVLIDDSVEGFEPAIVPELIDWECEGGKHNIKNSISGVLVLRQIILSAVFDGSKVSSIEDRQNERNIKKWKTKLDDWLAQDEILKDKLGDDQTLEHRFKIACESNTFSDEDDEDSLFLFSYSSSIAKELKGIFRTKLASSFRAVYSMLRPYESLIALSKEHGVTSSERTINNYYRSFKGKRNSLLAEPELGKAVKAYENEFLSITDGVFPYSVMGQKSIFKALFEGYLSECDQEENSYIQSTSDFIDAFNIIYDAISGSGNVDENFFSINYIIRKNTVREAGSIGKQFWKAIIQKSNDEIDYSENAVRLLSQIIQDMMSYVTTNNDEFVFTDYTRLVARHSRMLSKSELVEDYDDSDIKKLAEKVVNKKQKEVQRLLGNINN